MVKSKFYNLDTDTNLGGEESSDLYVASEKAVKAYVDAHAHAADNKSITENSLNQLQTVGVIDSNDSTKAIKTWTGTKEAYNGFFDLTWNGPIEDSELADYGEGGLAYNGTKFVYLYGSGYLSTSTNGTTWAEPTYIDNLGLGDDTWYGLASDGTKFVALSGDGYISTSTDGTTWTECTIDSNMGSHGWYGLASDGTKFVALGQPGYISTTTDGINWSVSTQDTNLANGDWRFLTYGNGKFVALSFYNYISTSTDGITWTTPVQISNFGNKDCNCLAYDGYKFVAINKSGEVSTSIDGITWTVPVVVPNFGQDNYSGALCYDGTKLVAILYNGIFTCLVTGSLDNNTLYNVVSDGIYLGTEKIAGNANDATLTITQNGTTKGTFSANASNNTAIALTDTTYSSFTGANGSAAGTTGLVPAPAASDNTKFLKGDGTWATVSSGTTYTAGTGIDITSGVISVTTPTLTNIATGSNSLTVGGINFNGPSSVNVGISSKASNGSTAVGYNAQAMAQASITIGQSANVASTASNSIAIGANTSCTGNTSIAIGINASTTATRAIQLGYGTNSEANSFYVSTSTSNNWKMLGSDGFIPDARLSSNIARISAIPTVDQTYSGTSVNAQSGVAVKSAIDAAVSSAYKAAGSVAFASLPALSSTNEGKVYNITDAFTTTADFVEGAGKFYPAGTNVVIINTTGTTYKYDVLSGFVDLSGYVPTSRTINSKALTSNITLNASDVGAVASNTAITGATKCKITYDTKGLVTAGADLSAGDIPNLASSKTTAMTGYSKASASAAISTSDSLNTAIGKLEYKADNAVVANSAITGATKCKITYDSKGLITAGADLAASDIPSLTLNKISDVTATATELNVLDGITATTTELNYIDGVTSNIQTQLNAKAADNAVVKLTGNQTIAGTKTFSTTPIVGTMTSTDNSTSAASTAFVKAQGYTTTKTTIRTWS